MWEDAQFQNYRYEIFTNFLLAQPLEKPIRINDFGCGYGALFWYLVNQSNVPLDTYFGYDLSVEMIKLANEEIKDPRARFIHSATVSEMADYSLASGTFNLKANAEEEDWATYIKSKLRSLWEKSALGMAFNLLDRDKTTANDDWLYYANSDEFLSYCRTEFSPEAELISHADMTDFTILARKAIG